MSITIAYAGMTHLGLNYAAASAEKGFRTIAFSPDVALVDALKSGVLPVVEPDLDRLVAGNVAAGRLIFTSDLSALSDCDIVYVAPDAPTDDRGVSDLSGIESLIELCWSAIPDRAALLILSQIPPGFTRRKSADRVDRLFCQVETLVFGRAVERALKPERFVVGCADPARPLPSALLRFLGAFDCGILPMRYESAELCKIAINCCLVASVSTANTLAELCEKIGASWSEIVPALRLDRRIGPYSYLAAGLGISGGNLERDLATVIRLADLHGTDAGVVRAWVANSRHRRDWVLNRLHETVLAGSVDPTIAILGLAYKENTHSTKNSPALGLLAALEPFRVRAFDPAVVPDPAWHRRMVACHDPIDAARGAHVVCVMTPWPAFAEISPRRLAEAMSGRLVIDPYRVLDPDATHAAGLVQLSLGAK